MPKLKRQIRKGRSAPFFHIEKVEDTKVMGADPNDVEISGQTALHLASASGHLEIAELLISFGANLNAMDQNFSTPLHLAVENENAAMVDLLMKSGANIELNNSYGCTPFELEGAKHPEIRKVLLRQEELISAIVDTNITQVEKLFNIYNVNSRVEKSLWTPLHFAILFTDLALIELLLKFGADVNAMDIECMTPSHLAVEIVNVDVVFLLLRNGANVNVKNEKRTNALIIARQLQRQEIYRMLVSTIWQ
ncbi:putative ankyrin repeat protein RF_0381 [Harmonia axyridis]|uniref:putative ankyrin repeat protein RF_0381 n=1 Tax=Harmonia axyridis TaxID=115357 RepID=UPI001E2757E7|nr:putative ankyrin repeat protein RF_0381 [Harmonia axyridis]